MKVKKNQNYRKIDLLMHQPLKGISTKVVTAIEISKIEGKFMT